MTLWFYQHQLVRSQRPRKQDPFFQSQIPGCFEKNLDHEWQVFKSFWHDDAEIRNLGTKKLPFVFVEILPTSKKEKIIYKLVCDIYHIQIILKYSSRKIDFQNIKKIV